MKTMFIFKLNASSAFLESWFRDNKILEKVFNAKKKHPQENLLNKQINNKSKQKGVIERGRVSEVRMGRITFSVRNCVSK